MWIGVLGGYTRISPATWPWVEHLLVEQSGCPGCIGAFRAVPQQFTRNAEQGMFGGAAKTAVNSFLVKSNGVSGGRTTKFLDF